MIKIAFVGPEGSGKTTLTEFFAQKYSTSKTIEYGSWYCKNILKGYLRNNVFLTKKKDYIKIIDQQEKLNGKAFQEAKRVCFLDTDYIFTKYFIDKQYVNWNWINFFVQKQTIDVFIFLKVHEIVIKPEAIIREETIEKETNLLLNYYKQFVKSKLIIVESRSYITQQQKIEQIIEDLLKKYGIKNYN